MSCLGIVIFLTFMLGLLGRHAPLPQFLVPECGLTGIVEKIKGGTDAVYGANPWMAYLYKDGNSFQCGGSLIHKRFVLTAAHCIVNDKFLHVRLGYHSASNASSSTVYNVTLAIRNRHYSKLTYQHDIGLLKLDPEVQFNDRIRPICIFTAGSQVPIFRSYTLTGWGYTESDLVANVLQTIKLNVLDSDQCYNNLHYPLISGQICAGSPTGDACKGDSGSPLGHWVNINGTSRYAQFGLVNYGIRSCTSPGVYTRVTSYADWIVDKMEIALAYKN